MNCANGDSLANATAQASDKNHVLEVLGGIAAELRRKLGESLASVQKYDAPAENVTTPSLEALQAYTLGYKAQILKNDYAAAIPLFQRAISLDPNFAMAYARLGANYFNLNETVRAADDIRKAFELRGGSVSGKSFTSPRTTGISSPGIWKQPASPMNFGQKLTRVITFPTTIWR